MIDLIVSKYNVFKRINNTVVGVNLKNRILFALEPDKYDTMSHYSDNLECLQQEVPALFSAMKKLGVISDVVSDENVYKSYVISQRINSFNTTSFKLTINPTLACNFNCWYCYETHTGKVMNEEIAQRVIKYIDNLIINERIAHLYLDWFGGEPLIGYENVMKPISEHAKTRCDEYKVELESGITTNGYLLKSSQIHFLRKINMNSFQITLDGNKNHHDTVRFAKNGASSYDVIVRNIVMIANDLHPSNLTLRINFTHENFDGIHEIINSFPKEARPNITVILQHVWQDQDKFDIGLDKLESLKQEFSDAGFKVTKDILDLKGYKCYADNFNQALINYDGRVFKCTAKNFEKEEEDGILTDNGDIEWKADLLFDLLANTTFENEYCKECKYLPVCFGPCSKKMTTVKNKHDFDKYCFVGGIENTLEYIMTKFEQSGQALAPLLNFNRD